MLINPKQFVKWRATLLYITSFSISLLVQINNISIHIALTPLDEDYT